MDIQDRHTCIVNVHVTGGNFGKLVLLLFNVSRAEFQIEGNGCEI